MEINHLELTGVVREIKPLRLSPAGVPQQEFLLAHRSRQEQAGKAREVRCELWVKVSGEGLQPSLHAVREHGRVTVTGFLSKADYRDASGRLTLNAVTVKVDSAPIEAGE